MAAPAISGNVINFNTGGLNYFQTTINSCVYNLGLITERGNLGELAYISRNIEEAITDAP